MRFLAPPAPSTTLPGSSPPAWPHDGRTSDLIEAIRAHRSAANTKYQASEASGSVALFDELEERAKQNLLNFLRSL
jgi:hypothetical protein